VFLTFWKNSISPTITNCFRSYEFFIPLLWVDELFAGRQVEYNVDVRLISIVLELSYKDLGVEGVAISHDKAGELLELSISELCASLSVSILTLSDCILESWVQGIFLNAYQIQKSDFPEREKIDVIWVLLAFVGL
jgi:hypothetical protein